MTVWVNTKADKSFAGAMGIGYPLDTRNDRDRNLMEEAQPGRRNHKPVTLEDKKEYSLYGFDNDSQNIPTYTYADTNAQGIQMRMDYSEAGDLIYEASIPLQTLYPGHSATASYASKTVAVGFILKVFLRAPMSPVEAVVAADRPSVLAAGLDLAASAVAAGLVSLLARAPFSEAAAAARTSNCIGRARSGRWCSCPATQHPLKGF